MGQICKTKTSRHLLEIAASLLVAFLLLSVSPPLLFSPTVTIPSLSVPPSLSLTYHSVIASNIGILLFCQRSFCVFGTQSLYLIYNKCPYLFLSILSPFDSPFLTHSILSCILLWITVIPLISFCVSFSFAGGSEGIVRNQCQFPLLLPLWHSIFSCIFFFSWMTT